MTFRRRTQITITFVLLIFGSHMAEAQVFKRILNETTRKAGQEIENMAVRKVSDLVARKIAQSVESAFDQMIREAMESDSNYVNKSDVPDSVYYSAGTKYAEFLRGMNDAANVPDVYSFDLNIVAETDDGSKPHEVKMFYSETQAILGIEQMEKEKVNLMVMDLENDVMVMYTTDKKGKKTAQALPSMMKFGSSIANKYDDDEAEFKRTKDVETVAGYPCVKYILKSKSATSQFFATDKIGIDWKDSYGDALKQFSPTTFRKGMDTMRGMVLKSIYTEKKKSKKVHTFEAREVNKEKTQITNSEWSFEGV